QMMLINVVLPAPFGPRSARISPRRIVRSMRLSAFRPLAYVLLRPVTVTMGGEAEGFSTTIPAAACTVALLRKWRQCSGSAAAARPLHAQVAPHPEGGAAEHQQGRYREACRDRFAKQHYASQSRDHGHAQLSVSSGNRSEAGHGGVPGGVSKAGGERARQRGEN